MNENKNVFLELGDEIPVAEFPVSLSGAGASTLMWANEHEIEPAALHQLRSISQLPWVHGVRVMPDVHVGKGATVGSVIAMRDAVSPAAVGVDIGCGMSAVRTDLTAADLPDSLHALRTAIERAVPVGFSAHKNSVDVKHLKVDRIAGRTWHDFWGQFNELPRVVQHREGKAHAQMGSLGGGNHFIEVCTDDADAVWLMLHSGSRNIGNEVASHHMEIARGLPHNAAIADRDLSVFVAGTPQMDAYRRDLNWAQEYALRNRAVILALVMQVVTTYFGRSGRLVRYDEPISCHHNYVAEEVIDGEPMLVTRKGAIRAGSGDLGLIPGSMGTGSYVVRGLGNTASFCSASHGAGRVMSRSKAKRTFTTADLATQTAGVECRKDVGVLDEIPGAYKNLESVLTAQRTLVDVVTRLTTRLCVKG